MIYQRFALGLEPTRKALDRVPELHVDRKSKVPRQCDARRQHNPLPFR